MTEKKLFNSMFIKNKFILLVISVLTICIAITAYHIIISNQGTDILGHPTIVVDIPYSEISYTNINIESNPELADLFFGGNLSFDIPSHWSQISLAGKNHIPSLLDTPTVVTTSSPITLQGRKAGFEISLSKRDITLEIEQYDSLQKYEKGGYGYGTLTINQNRTLYKSYADFPTGVSPLFLIEATLVDRFVEIDNERYYLQITCTSHTSYQQDLTKICDHVISSIQQNPSNPTNSTIPSR